MSDRRSPSGAAAEHQHEFGWYCCEQTREGMIERMSKDECVLVSLPDRPTWKAPFCVTHGVFSDPGHAHDKGGLATLD